jgi:hypothetical protein
MLTMYDPLRGIAPVKRERRQRKGRKPNKRGRERVEGSTATKKSLGELEERRSSEKHPLFLLLVPGNIQPERLLDESDEAYHDRCVSHTNTYLSESYFAFLDMRAPWAMALEWSEYLWQRGKERSENVPLVVWCAKNEEVPDVFSEAWLCQPNIALLHTDLVQARREGRIGDLSGETRVMVSAN